MGPLDPPADQELALLIPIISKKTHDRIEEYFRLEWKLAVDRCHLKAADHAFLLPVAVDETRDDDERVPERFRDAQWTRLPGGETPPAFGERVWRLLTPAAPHAPAPRHEERHALSAATSGERVSLGVVVEARPGHHGRRRDPGGRGVSRHGPALDLEACSLATRGPGSLRTRRRRLPVFMSMSPLRLRDLTLSSQSRGSRASRPGEVSSGRFLLWSLWSPRRPEAPFEL